VLDAKIKDLAQISVGINQLQARVISAEREGKLWEMVIMGTDIPKHTNSIRYACI